MIIHFEELGIIDAVVITSLFILQKYYIQL